MQKHILVITQYFYPEQFRINDICTEWVKRGYKVTVVTGIPNYPYGDYFKGYGLFNKRTENYNGIEIIRLPLIPRKKSSLFLGLNYVSFVLSGYFWKIFTKIEADLVFTFEVSPMTQALLGVWYSKKLNVPSILYVQDLWPENLEIVGGIKNSSIINNVKKMVDYIYKNTDLILATSPSFKTHIENSVDGWDLNVRFWPQYSEENNKIANINDYEIKIPNDSIFNIIFAGNIGYAQGLDILPNTAKILKDKNISVRFNIIGDGRFKTELINMINKNNIEEYFNFIDRQPAEIIPSYLEKSDMAFLSFSNNDLFKKTIPAKLQTYLNSGIPVIGAVSGESRRIVQEAKCGVTSEPENEKLLAKNIEKCLQLSKEDLEIMGNNSKKYAETKFNKQTLMDEMEYIIQEYI